jgi:hypothetical protein
VLGRDAERRNGAYLPAHGGGKVDQLSRRGMWRLVNRFEWYADLIEHFSYSCLCFLPSLPPLRRLKGLVRALPAWRSCWEEKKRKKRVPAVQLVLHSLRVALLLGVGSGRIVRREEKKEDISIICVWIRECLMRYCTIEYKHVSRLHSGGIKLLRSE